MLAVLVADWLSLRPWNGTILILQQWALQYDALISLNRELHYRLQFNEKRVMSNWVRLTHMPLIIHIIEMKYKPLAGFQAMLWLCIRLFSTQWVVMCRLQSGKVAEALWKNGNRYWERAMAKVKTLFSTAQLDKFDFSLFTAGRWIVLVSRRGEVDVRNHLFGMFHNCI